MIITFLIQLLISRLDFSQKVLEAVKPKKTKLGTAMRSQSMRSETSSQLEADASLLHENENEIDLTVEIEVVSVSLGRFD